MSYYYACNFLTFYKNSKITNKNNLTYSNVRTYKEYDTEPKLLQAMVAATFGCVGMAFLIAATQIRVQYLHKVSVYEIGLVIKYDVLVRLSRVSVKSN